MNSIRGDEHAIPATFDGQPVEQGRRWRLHLKHAVAALAAGAGTVPFGDNGDVFRALADARARERQPPLTPCS